LAYIALATVAILGAFFTYRWLRGNSPAGPPGRQGSTLLGVSTAIGQVPASAPVSQAASRPGGAVVSFDDGPVIPAAGAAALMEQGAALVAREQLVAGRAALADALNSGGLSPQQAAAVRAQLEQLAQKMIFSRDLVEGDACVRWYQVKSGDVLQHIERNEKLHVPDRLLLKINALPDASKLQAGQKLKVIQGPFHAVVRKSQFVMDVYLQEPLGGRMIFVKRYNIGTGAGQTSTPEGVFRLTLGGKLVNAPYTPPPSTGLPQVKILPGQKDYPLDKNGLWIGLSGIPEKGNKLTAEDGYGIHGTNDASSIGKATSRGCVRLSDTDIEQVYLTLYEQWSTVTIKP
jgi:LysM repeat protein